MPDEPPLEFAVIAPWERVLVGFGYVFRSLVP
jgi:hypothetical protein